MDIPLLNVQNISKNIKITKMLFLKKNINILNAINFELNQAETLVIMGENGSGKSTLIKILAGITEASSGLIEINGDRNIFYNSSHRTRLIRMIFSYSSDSLNPSLKIGDILENTLKTNTNMNSTERKVRVNNILKKVGLISEHASFYSSMLSAGQKQRVMIARSLILQPSIIISDESINGLDISIRAQILNLLIDLQKEMGLSYIFISQNVDLAKHLSDKVIILKNGEIVEQGPTKDVLFNPQQSYTKKIISFE